MRRQYLRCPKSFLILKMIRNYWLSCLQREASWRLEIISYARDADDARAPTYPGADKKAPLGGNMLENLAEIGPKAASGEAGCFTQQLFERCAL